MLIILIFKNPINTLWYQIVLNMVISQQLVYCAFYTFLYLFLISMNYLVARKIFLKYKYLRLGAGRWIQSEAQSPQGRTPFLCQQGRERSVTLKAFWQECPGLGSDFRQRSFLLPIRDLIRVVQITIVWAGGPGEGDIKANSHTPDHLQAE